MSAEFISPIPQALESRQLHVTQECPEDGGKRKD
jgi:hypothetical protein